MTKLARVFVLFASATCLSVYAQGPAAQLARILAGKGVLTNEEMEKVERADSAESVRLLASILYQKGALTESEWARVNPGDAAMDGVRAVPAALTQMKPAAQPPRAQEAPPPVSSAARFPVQIYGTVLWNSFYNTAGVNIEDIPLLATKRGTDPYENFGMTLRQSRFGLRYQGPTVAGAKLSGTVELDFFGGKDALSNAISMDIIRLRLAYGRLDWKNASLEVGQDWTVFSPLNPTSLATFGIPALSTSGNPWMRTPQFRFEWHGDASNPTRWLWQVAALDPDVGDYPAAFLTVRNPGIGERGRGPAVETRLALLSKIGDRDASVGLSSHYNRGKNVATLGGQILQRAVDAWGVNLDYTLPLHRKFALTGEAFVGRALGIFSVSSGQAVLPPGTPGEHGVLGRGGWVQAQFNLHPKWQVNMAYGLESLDQSNLRTGDRGKNQTYMTNLMYKFSPHLTWAWEWRRFLTNYSNQATLNAAGDHANMAVSYIF
jgi:hypothetical protein